MKGNKTSKISSAWYRAGIFFILHIMTSLLVPRDFTNTLCVWDAFTASDVVDRTAPSLSLGICILHQHIHNYSGTVLPDSSPLPLGIVSSGVLPDERPPTFVITVQTARSSVTWAPPPEQLGWEPALRH